MVEKTLTNYCYSRFFDVAVFDLTTLDIGSVRDLIRQNMQQVNLTTQMLNTWIQTQETMF